MAKQWYEVKGRRVLTPQALRDCNEFLISLRFTRRHRRNVLATWSAPEDLDEVIPPRKGDNDRGHRTRIAQDPLKNPPEG